MSLISSIRAFSRLFAEDSALARLGVPRGWLLRMHYRGRWAARRRHSPSAEHVAICVRERKLNLELSAAYEGAFKGIFLENEYDCAGQMTKPPARILDLGANIGMGALYFKSIFPKAEIVCVEPDPRNLPLLKRNLKINGVSAVIKSAAVGGTAGTLNLRFGDNPTCSALESSPMHALAATVSVDVQTVGQILGEVGWSTVDLIKIDIEGTEDELLSINNAWLRFANALIMEIHPNTTEEKIAGYLKPYGFTLRRIGFGMEPVYFASRESI